MTRRLAPALVVWLLAVAPALAVSYGDVEVTVENMPTGTASHGYTAYEFVITNRSREQSHQVRLRLPETNYSRREDHIRALTRGVTVEPGATVRVSLLQPVYLSLNGRGVAVTVDGQDQEEALPIVFNAVRSGYGMHGGYYYSGGYGPPVEPLLLVSDAVGDAFRTRAETKISARAAEAAGGGGPGGRGMGMPGGFRGGGMASSGSHVQLARVRLPVSSWDGNWLAYSRYDGIVVTASELRVPSAGRTALWQYAECGGALVILGKPEPNVLPRSWKGEPVPPTVIMGRPVKPRLIRYQAGFGVCLVSEDLPVKDGKWATRWDDNWPVLQDAWGQSGAPWLKPRSIAQANALFPVVEDIGIPVRGLFVLMLAFVILIGPVNLWVLARRQRRIWLLWTAPVISLVTCLAVVGYMLLVEGWRGHLRTEVITILDHGTKRATTIGWTAFYSPLTPGDGLHFSTATELFPQRAEPFWRGSGTACSTDWSQDQHLAGGWMVARVPAHFKVRKSETRHERVALKKTGTGYTMTNLLGEDVLQFWFADHAGHLYRADRVPAGKEAALTGQNQTAANVPNRLQLIYKSDWLPMMGDIPGNPARHLAKGTYLAVVDGSPFFEDGLRNAGTRKRRTLVLGILEAADAR